MRHTVSSEIATQLMYDEIDYDMERSGFFDHLRHLGGLEDQSLHKVHQLCDYIYWATASNIELYFELTDEEFNRCLLVKEKGTYSEFLAHDELMSLPINEMMHMLLDMAQIVSGEVDWREAETFADYFNGSVFPKVALFSTHQETVAPLLGAFQSMMLTNPGPASSIFFMFYTHWDDELDSEPEQRVKVSFSETPWDLESIETLSFVPEQLENPGHISLASFSDYVAD